MKVIIDIDKELKSAIYNCGLFLNPAEKMSLINAINNGTPIPDNATNGDVIKAIFPNIQISDSEVMKNVYTGIPYGELIGANIDCMRDWWNAPYQKGDK